MLRDEHSQRRPRVQWIGLVAIVAALASCSRTVEIAVEIQADARVRWDEILSTSPLPEAFVIVDDPTREPLVTLRSRVSSALAARSDTHIVLDRTWLAPTASLADVTAEAWLPPRDASGEEAPAAPLAELRLPDLALPVDGVYADDPEYPLVDQLVLDLDPTAAGLEPDDERLALLETWFASLEPTAVPPPALSWIGGVGDLMVARGVTRFLDHTDGLEVVFSDVLPELRRVDFLLGNLEGAVTTRGTPLPKSFTFRFHPRVLGPLAAAGFDYLSVVNNHSFDYGATGFMDTIAHLRASPIATSGVGADLAEARVPYRTALPAADVTVLSVGAYPVENSGFDGAHATAATVERAGVLWADARNPAAQRAAFEAMRDAFGPDTVDIVMVHGGAEWATRPSDSQRTLYRLFVDAGADIVLGHHSHVVQGLESYRGSLIAYSLGNFVFPGMYATEYGEQSVLLRIGVVDGRVAYVEPIPVRINHQLLSIDTGTAMLERFAAATRALHAPAP